MPPSRAPGPKARAAGRRGFHRYRRGIQFAFLLLFFGLLTATVWPLGSLSLGIFLGADPLIALNSAMNGVWLWPMALAALVLATPLVIGRAFCGYVCPLGTILEVATPACGPSGRRALSSSWSTPAMARARQATKSRSSSSMPPA